jgi:alpha-tubulin suppressor-like RCC1 family protein
VACGKAHTVVLIERGGRTLVYTIGSNKTGQLGIGKNIKSAVEPQIVEALSNYTIVKVACSKSSTFALTETGELFAWGSNKEGVLGLGSEGYSSGD